MIDHDPSEIGILRPIIVRGNGDFIDQMVARGTLKETVPMPECANSHAVQPIYRYISEPMPVARVSIVEGLHDVLLRSARATHAELGISDIGKGETDPN